MLFVTPSLSIPAQFLEMRTARSSGPGGQHVNKTETQVELRLDVGACDVLREDQKERLRDLAGSRMTKEDVLQIVCGRHRERLQNTKEAEQRMRELIIDALVPPRPRKKTRVPRGVKRRRLKNKRKRGERKASRGRRWGEND